MAKKQLTIEEKLQAALVPVEEQPYKVPENWCWVRLSALLRELKNGTTIKQDKSGTGYKVTRIESLQQQTIDFDRLGNIVDKNKIKETDWYEAGDVALSHINSAEHVGKTAVIQENMLPLVHGMNLLRLRFNDLCQPILFQLFSRSYQYKSEIRARINMAVNQVSINQKNLGTVEFPLPPINEQSRIVARIESLFAKLDEAKEKIQEVLDGADLRRAAILHQAFTGRLTEKWRKENGVSDEWSETSSAELFEYVTSGSRGWAQYYSDDGAIFLRMGNLNHGTIDLDLSDIQYVNLPDKAEGQRSLVKKGDVLISITADVGMVACIKEEMEEAYINQHVALARPVKENFSEFIAWYFVSDVGLKQLQSMQRGATKVGLTLKDIKSVKLKMPCIEEQQEIVHLLDNLLTREQSTVTACEEALTTIDTLKKSILARAFRGELGTNDPAEPSAQGLLQEILEA